MILSLYDISRTNDHMCVRVISLRKYSSIKCFVAEITSIVQLSFCPAQPHKITWKSKRHKREELSRKKQPAYTHTPELVPVFRIDCWSLSLSIIHFGNITYCSVHACVYRSKCAFIWNVWVNIAEVHKIMCLPWPLNIVFLYCPVIIVKNASGLL